MERNLCVSASVDDDLIHRAWRCLFGNNAIKQIEVCDSKKVIHLHDPFHPYYTENIEERIDEDEMAEIIEMYEELGTEGTLTFSVCDPSNDWWMYGRQNEEHSTVRFDVCFE
jgi:hypothetical protein